MYAAMMQADRLQPTLGNRVVTCGGRRDTLAGTTAELCCTLIGGACLITSAIADFCTSANVCPVPPRRNPVGHRRTAPGARAVPSRSANLCQANSGKKRKSGACLY